MTETGEQLRRPDGLLPGWSRPPARPIVEIPSARPGFGQAIGAVANWLIFERRLILIVPFAMIAGMAIWASAGSDPYLPVWTGALVVSLAFLWVARGHSAMFVLSTVVTSMLSGFVAVGTHAVLFGTHMLSRPVVLELTGTVKSMISQSEGESRFVLEEIGGLDGNLPEALTGVRTVRIYARRAPPLAAGDRIEGRFRFYPIPGPATPGGYDSQFQSYFDGIGAYGTALGEIGRTEGASSQWPAATVFSQWRAGIGARIRQVTSGEARDVLLALVIGDQSQISEDLRSDMAGSGLAHVLAISGLHLTLVAGGAFAAIRMALALGHQLTLRLDVKRIGAIGGLLVALIYLGLSGASVSAIRASLMLSLVFVAVLVGRRAITLRNVALAAIFVLLTDPASLFRPSFQLSFAAVVALVAVFETFRTGKTGSNGLIARVWRYAAGIALTSLIAGLATAVFAGFHFQNAAPFGVLANMLALPIVGFLILPAAFLGLLAMPFGLDGPLFTASSLGIDWMLAIARFVAGLEPAGWRSPIYTPAALLIVTAGLALLVLIRSRWRLLPAAACVPLVLLFGTIGPPDILVSNSTSAVAVRDGGQYALISGRPGSFVTDAWQQAYGVNVGNMGSHQPCDPLGCVATIGERTLNVAKSYDAFSEDCAPGSIVVSGLYAPVWCGQRGATVIDRQVLDRSGVQALRVAGDHTAIEAAIPNPERAFRP